MWRGQQKRSEYLEERGAKIVILDITENEFRKTIVEARRPAVVLFHMPRCPYCVEFMPRFQELSRNMKAIVVQLDISDYDSDLWDEYQIEAVPTVIAFKGGQVCARADAILHVGLSVERLKEEMRKRSECF